MKQIGQSTPWLHNEVNMNAAKKSPSITNSASA
jgi:hypothetical protein